MDLARRTPPLSPADGSLNLPLPRPPAWIWLFTTQIGPPSDFAAASASVALNTGTPRGTGAPNSCNTALAWYSWIFIPFAPAPTSAPAGFLPLFSQQVGRDLLAGVDQPAHRVGRFV